MNLEDYRKSETETQRTSDIAGLIGSGHSALDIGARDGRFSKILAGVYDLVVALDLETPTIEHPKIACAKGDVTALDFADKAFDLVLCAEVLEHIQPALLEQACRELSRVSRNHVLVGVPYWQDIRVGRTTSRKCGGKNPPWGQVKSFDDARLTGLFPGFTVQATSYIGAFASQTNACSAFLMDLAGNPYGTYVQEEPRIHCGGKLTPPPRNIGQKNCDTSSFVGASCNETLRPAQAELDYVLLKKQLFG